ncbi:hypothetical protein [Clostridium guangxiense]|uniref:hypothetical protein n=1 Tax=Clostridium guangxiense TaxID=1662055 RepID=UPI001E502DEF|nr:hypothetical protein [Clostridium guangxiense]MCD2345086.1 hypothetical protein [Clostridium guangxiense]
MEEVINCSSEKSIINSLRSGKKLVVVTENNDLKEIEDKAKIYTNFKRIYSFKNELTIIKLTEDRKIDKITVNILLILLKTAKNQNVDLVYMPKEYKTILCSSQFDRYQDIIKFM